MKTQPNKSELLREAYIDEIVRGLRGKETALQVYEQSEELREHLNALAEAHIEMGVEPSSAMEVAIESFGEAKVIAAGLGTSTESTTPPENAYLYFMLLVPSCLCSGSLLIMYDTLWAAATGYMHHTDFKRDFIIGATFGFLALILAVQVKRSPKSLGRIVTAIGLVITTAWLGPLVVGLGPSNTLGPILGLLTLLPLMFVVGYATRSMVLMTDSYQKKRA